MTTVEEKIAAFTGLPLSDVMDLQDRVATLCAVDLLLSPEGHKALGELQSAIGVTDGGPASYFFTGERDAAWLTQSPRQRREIVGEYLDFERAFYAEDEAETTESAPAMLGEAHRDADEDYDVADEDEADVCRECGEHGLVTLSDSGATICELCDAEVCPMCRDGYIVELLTDGGRGRVRQCDDPNCRHIPTSPEFDAVVALRDNLEALADAVMAYDNGTGSMGDLRRIAKGAKTLARSFKGWE